MSDLAAAPVPEKPSKGRVFLRRLGSTAWLWAIVIPAFCWNRPWLFLLMFVGISIAGLIEFFRLIPDAEMRRFRNLTLPAAAAYGILAFAPDWGWSERWAHSADALALAFFFLAISVDRLRSRFEPFRMSQEIGMTVFGFSYIVILFGFIPRILHLPLEGRAGEPSAHFYVIFLLVVTKFTDMGAYVVGTTLGRHLMVPRISPKKTWEGFAGALVVAQIGSFGCLWLFSDRIPLITPVHAFLLGVVIALFAILGDLVESILKRSAAVKDSGKKMPGIGGILDLMDSIFLTSPAFFVYLCLLLE